MRKSNFKVLSRRRCPKSPRPGASIVFSSHEVTNSNSEATKQTCNACFTGSGGQHVESPIMLILT